MRTSASFLLIFGSLSALALAATAAPFENMGFDQLQIPDGFPVPIPWPPFEAAPASWITPGWTVAGLSGNIVGHNYSQGFGGYASILNRDFRDTSFGGNAARPVVGSFSLGVWPLWDVRADQFPFVLRQTGDIPADAQSLTFLYHGENLRVYVGDSLAPVLAWKDEPSGNSDVPVFHYFGVDVSKVAGQTLELKFEFRSPSDRRATMHVLDDLQFQTFSVPEPQTWALIGIGAAVLGWHCPMLQEAGVVSRQKWTPAACRRICAMSCVSGKYQKASAADEEILQIHEALDPLAAHDPEKAQNVRLHVFVGPSHAQTAQPCLSAKRQCVATGTTPESCSTKPSPGPAEALVAGRLPPVTAASAVAPVAVDFEYPVGELLLNGLPSPILWSWIWR